MEAERAAAKEAARRKRDEGRDGGDRNAREENEATGRRKQKSNDSLCISVGARVY